MYSEKAIKEISRENRRNELEKQNKTVINRFTKPQVQKQGNR